MNNTYKDHKGNYFNTDPYASADVKKDINSVEELNAKLTLIQYMTHLSITKGNGLTEKYMVDVSGDYVAILKLLKLSTHDFAKGVTLSEYPDEPNTVRFTYYPSRNP
jgi:hypothetical protein